MKKAIVLLLVFLGGIYSAHVNAVVVNYNFRFKIPDLKKMRIITPGLTNGVNLRLYVVEPGSSVIGTAEAVDSHSYLQVTSIAPMGEVRKINVQITSGNVPSGTLLKLSATNCTTGDGNRGTANSNISLSTIAQTLIDGMGSCYTGTTNTSGYNLTYTWSPDPEHLNQIQAFHSYQLQVTFTLTGN
jgi:hypothetical protein